MYIQLYTNKLVPGQISEYAALSRLYATIMPIAVSGSLLTCPMADIHENLRNRIRFASPRVLFRTSLYGFQINFLQKKKENFVTTGL